MQRKHLLIGALVALPLLAISGASAFAAAGQPGTSRAQTFIADVASHLGISTAKLTGALQQAGLDQVESRLEAGKISSARATRMEDAIKSGRLGPALADGPWGMRHRRPGRLAARRDAMRAATSYLGLTHPQIVADLKAGKSLSAVATATSGKTVQGLEAAVTSAMQQHLRQAVTDRRMTQARATKISQRLQTLVQTFVTRTGFVHGRPEPWGRLGGGTAPAPGSAPITN